MTNYLRLYYWTHYYASPKWRNPLSFLVGFSNTLGLVGGLCSIDCKLIGPTSIPFMLTSLDRRICPPVPLRDCYFTRWQLDPKQWRYLCRLHRYCRMPRRHCFNTGWYNGSPSVSFRHTELRSHIRHNHRTTNWETRSEQCVVYLHTH